MIVAEKPKKIDEILAATGIVRVNQWKSERKWVDKALFPFASMLLLTLKQFRRIRGNIALHYIGGMKLS